MYTTYSICIIPQNKYSEFVWRENKYVCAHVLHNERLIAVETIEQYQQSSSFKLLLSRKKPCNVTKNDKHTRYACVELSICTYNCAYVIITNIHIIK